MNKDLRTLLLELANSNPEDKIARLFAYFYPNIKDLDRNRLFEFLHSKIGEANEIDISELKFYDDEIKLEEFENKDYRIKSIEIASLRGIPDLDEDKIPFGIDFTDIDQIDNAIILANNGVGKSSLFAGMEMVFAQEIGEKQLRSVGENVSKEGFNDYLKRFGSAINPICRIKTVDAEASLMHPIFENRQELKTFNPSNHFISDFDIFNYGRINFSGDANDKNSFHSIIANALGLSDFIHFQDVVLSTSNYRRLVEKKKHSELVGEKKDKEKTIINVKVLLDRYREELKTFGNNNKQNSNDNDRIEKITQSFNKSLFNNLSSEDLTKIIASYRKIYNQRLSSDKNSKSGIEQDFLDAASHLLHNASDCPLCDNSNSSIEEIRKFVEERLAKLKLYESEEKHLKEIFKSLFERLNQFLTNFKSFIDFIAAEKELIRLDPKLDALLDVEETFYLKFAPVLYDAEMFEFVDEMSKKFSITSEDFESALSFVNGPIIGEIGSIIDELIQFLNGRNELSKEWKDQNAKPGSQIERKVQLEQEITRLEAQLKENEARLKTIEPEIELAKVLMERVDEVKIGLQDFFPKLEIAISKIVLSSFDPVQEIVQLVMKDYLKEKHLDLNIKIESRTTLGEDITKQVIVAQIIDTNTGELITPDVYFNTFRYKLFALMISLSLALATRQKYKINLPLVMDDLFSGSDFVSKNSFSEFLIKVIQLFQKYTPELPLQFILFTHDDVIFKSAMDAIFDPDTSNNRLNIDHYDLLTRTTKVGRFFKPEDKESKPKTFGLEEQFWNLLYELPKTVSI